MDSILDAIIAVVERAADSWLGMFALTSPIWLLAAVRTRQAWQRRRAFRDFAAAHQLQFVGTIPSDARAPYTRIESVRRAVLLSNVWKDSGTACRSVSSTCLAAARRAGRWCSSQSRARCAAVRGRSA